MNIAVLGLPIAIFDSAHAIAEFKDEAKRFELAVADYEATGNEYALEEALHELGIDWRENEWHVANRGKRMPRGYMSAASI
jgi:hypothetical protein